MADIGSLIVKIGADASGLEKAFHQLGGSAKQFQQGLVTIGKIGATAFVAATSAAVAMTIAAGRQAEQLEQLSGITGINTDKLQEYEVMLNRAGLTGDDLAVVMKNMSNSLEQAQLGTGTAADRFRQLGIDIRTVTSTDDLIQKIAISANRFADGTAKAALMSDLLGKGWQTFMRVFQGGKAVFDEVRASSDALGKTMSTQQIAVLAKMDNQIDDLMLAFTRFGQQMGADLAPNITIIVQLLQRLLVIGAEAFHELSLRLDIFSTSILHFGLQMEEVAGVLFSRGIFSPEAWKKALENMQLIGAEADKQIMKLKAASALRTPAVDDTRKKVPGLVDTAKQAAAEQAMVDESLRSFEQGLRNKESMQRAQMANYLAMLDEQKAAGLLSDREVAEARQASLVQMDNLVEQSLKVQLAGYQKFVAAKLSLYTEDEKGQAARLKFAEEAARKEAQLENDIAVAHLEADTTKRTSGLAIKSFWDKQLDDLVASNAFSVSQIVTTWTSGIANAIVNGGNFVQAAWKTTQIAIIQGGLNLVVQWAAQQAMMAGASVATASFTTAVWAGATTAIGGFFAATTAAFSAMAASMVGVMTAVGTFVMGVLSAIAEALADTIFGIPWAVAIIAGIVLIAAALALSGNLGFKEGGIGNFGKGTPAMLHGPEAVIPLNSRGASFMREAFGGGGGQQTIVVQLDERVLLRAVLLGLPRYARLHAGGA